MKALALAQHLGLDFISFNGEIYLNVTLEDFNTENETTFKTVEDDNETFLEWLQQNGTLIEDEIVQSTYNENLFEYGSEEYLVCTDDEADELWEESLDNYLEECIYPELQGNLKNYFDDEKWKQDAKFDGRGHSLSGYDGRENYEDVDGETFYIYRQN
jgi:hypothetical protein